MALDKLNKVLPLYQGIDSKVDQRVPTLQMEKVLNGRSDKVGSVKKRCGYDSKSLLVSDTGLPMTVLPETSYITSFNNKLFNISLNEVHQYNDSLNSWDRLESSGVYSDPKYYTSKPLSSFIKNKLAEGNNVYTIDNIDSAIAGEFMLITYIRLKADQYNVPNYSNFYGVLNYSLDTCYAALININTGFVYWQDVEIPALYTQVLPCSIPGDVTGIPAFNVLWVDASGNLKSSIIQITPNTTEAYVAPNFSAATKFIPGFGRVLRTSVDLQKFVCTFRTADKGSRFAVLYQSGNNYFTYDVTMTAMDVYSYNFTANFYTLNTFAQAAQVMDIVYTSSSNVYSFIAEANSLKVYNNASLVSTTTQTGIYNINAWVRSSTLYVSMTKSINYTANDDENLFRKIETYSYNTGSNTYTLITTFENMEQISKAVVDYAQTSTYLLRTFTQNNMAIASKLKQEGAEYYLINLVTGFIENKINASSTYAAGSNFNYATSTMNCSLTSYYRRTIQTIRVALGGSSVNECIPLKEIISTSSRLELKNKLCFKRFYGIFLYTGNYQTFNYLNKAQANNGSHVAHSLIYKHNNSVSYNGFIYNADFIKTIDGQMEPTGIPWTNVTQELENGQEYEYKVIFTHLDKEKELSRSRTTFAKRILTPPNVAANTELFSVASGLLTTFNGEPGIILAKPQADKLIVGFEYEGKNGSGTTVDATIVVKNKYELKDGSFFVTFNSSTGSYGGTFKMFTKAYNSRAVPVISFELPSDILKAGVTYEVYRTRKLSSGDVNFYKLTKVATSNTGVGIPATIGISADNCFITLADFTSDVELINNELLYTAGDVLDNFQPSSVLTVSFGKNRMFYTDSQNKSRLYYSKPKITGLNYEFSELFYLDSQDSEDITGHVVMDDKVIVFTRNNVYYTYGDGPSANGASGSFQPLQLIQSDVGCSQPMSIIKTDTGTWFKSSKGLYFINRGLQCEYKGSPMEDFNNQRITNSFSSNTRNEVYFECLATLSNTPESLLFVYNEFQETWSTFTNHRRCELWNDKIIQFNNNYTGNNLFLVENSSIYTDGSIAPYINNYDLVIKTRWLQLNEIMNYTKIWSMMLLGKYVDAHSIKVDIFRNYDENIFQTKTLTRSSPTYNPNLVKVSFKDTETQAFKLQFTESSTTAGFEFSSVNLEFGVSPGHYKAKNTN